MKALRALAGPALSTLLLVAVAAACGDEDAPEPRVVEDEQPSQVTNPDAEGGAGAADEPLEGVPDPCELVTADEVVAVTGQEVAASAYQQLGPGSVSCNHRLDDEGTVGTSVGITVEQAEAELATYDELDDTEAVEDLGDEASWSPTLGALAVLEGDTLLTVSLLVVDDDLDELREQAVELAELGLERLAEA